MEEIKEAMALITEQQSKAEQFGPVYGVGEQLKDLIANDPAVAGLVAADLKQEGMSLADCEKKIKAWADQHHKKGMHCVFVPPMEAEKIIREFYGLGEAREPKPEMSSHAREKEISLFDFM